MLAPLARTALRASRRSLAAPAAARSVSLLAAARPVARAAVPAAAPQQVRGIKHIDFSGDGQIETVYERADWPIERLHEYFKDDTLALVSGRPRVRRAHAAAACC